MKRIVALAACAALAACSSGSSDADAGPAPTALVSLAKATNGNVAETAEVYGAIEQNADTQFTLSAPVEAVVKRLVRQVGNPVRRGDAIITLVPSPGTAAAAAQSHANVQALQQAYDRAKRLRGDGLASDADVETARAAAAGAQAQARALSAQIAGLTLRSPGAGYVQTIAVNPEDQVAAGATIATISRSGSLRARFGIDPQLLHQLVRGEGISIAPAGGGTGVRVPILSVDPSVDPQTRLASLYAEVPSSYGVGAGQPLSGSVILRQAHSQVVVPYTALLNDGGQPFVYVVDKGIAHRRDVVPGATNGKQAAIEQGVKPGDLVVTNGGTALEDGMKVRTK